MTTSENSRYNRSYPVPPAYIERLLPFYDPAKDGRLIDWLTANLSAYLQTLDLSALQPVLAVDQTSTVTLTEADHNRLTYLCDKHNLSRREGIRYLFGQFIQHGPLVSAKETV